jgi:ABC-type siderophore export system fused ATPase/permease subunit
VIAVPLAGVELTAGDGAAARTVGPVAVAVVSLASGAAGWGLLAFLRRRLRGGRRAWRVIACAVLALSLLGPIGMGASAAATAVLVAMHLAVGVTLILGLPASTP